MCENTRQGLKGLVRFHGLARRHREELVYPKGKVQEFFTVDQIRKLGACECKLRGCCFHASQAQPPKYFTNELIIKIRDQFTSALAFLVSFDAGLSSLIFELIEKGFNDERLTEKPLTNQEIEQLLSSTWENRLEEFDIRNFHRRQHEFFIPQLAYKSPHHKIDSARSLPFNVTEEAIGSGAYSIVYKAELLPEYHDFPDIKDGLIAIKTYNDWSAAEDCIKERSNNEFWGSHKYIMPLQTSIEHRDIFMTIWPLAKHDLQSFLQNDPPEEYKDDPSKAWKRFKNLLSALNHIHSSIPGLYGYHFDIKPHNILVRFDGDWAITDLGLAYSKVDDTGVSATSRYGGNERYRAPETIVHRNYDVWAMGCIGCEIIVWLSKGSNGVEKFRKDREMQDLEGISILDNFHSQGRLKQPVISFFEDIEKHGDDLTRRVAAILRQMLETDPSKRLNARAAEGLFGGVLGMSPPVTEPTARILGPLLHTTSRRPSLNVHIPSERFNKRRSPLSTTFAPDEIVFGSPGINVPQIHVTSESDNLAPPALAKAIGDSSNSAVVFKYELEPPENSGEGHGPKRALAESPITTDNESKVIESELRPEKRHNFLSIVKNLKRFYFWLVHTTDGVLHYRWGLGRESLSRSLGQ